MQSDGHPTLFTSSERLCAISAFPQQVQQERSEMVSFVRFVALAAVACAALAASSSASPLKDDPYTLANGRVIDPTKSEDVQAAKEAAENREAAAPTTLHDSPMRGYNRLRL